MDIITAKENEANKANEANEANEANKEKWLDIDWSKLKWTLQNI